MAVEQGSSTAMERRVERLRVLLLLPLDYVPWGSTLKGVGVGGNFGGNSQGGFSKVLVIPMISWAYVVDGGPTN